MRIKTHLIFIFLLVVITIAAYCNSFPNSFAYDDYAFVVNNPSIKHLNFNNLKYYFTDKFTASSDRELSGDNWRPLVTASFAVDYKLWKLEPKFYHIENTFLHILNTILLYIIATLILRNPLASFIAALVFAIHPVQTEAVSWISGRSNLLFMLFLLSAFLLHIRDRKAVPGTLNYYLLLILFTCGLFSKETAIILPLIMITYDLHFHLGKKFKHYLSYYLPLFTIAGAYFITRFFVLERVSQDTSWWGGSFTSNTLVMIKAMAGYIRLLVLPVGLGIEYTPGIPRSVFSLDILISVVLLLSVFIIWLKFRGTRRISFFICWFFIALIPVSNIIPVKAIMAERFLYLPMAAFGALFSLSFLGLARRLKFTVSRTVLFGLLALIFALYAYGTIVRNSQWKNEITLYSKEVMRLPESPRSHYNLAFVYAKAARLAPTKKAADGYYIKAIKEYGEVLKLKPEYHLAYFTYTALGDIYNETGRYKYAVESFKRARSIRRSRDVLTSMAVSFFRKKDYPRAALYCRKAVLQDPEDADAYMNLGSVYLVMNERLRARRAYLKAASLSGGNPKLIKAINSI